MSMLQSGAADKTGHCPGDRPTTPKYRHFRERAGEAVNGGLLGLVLGEAVNGGAVGATPIPPLS